jgi:2-polyprenyl-6-methoxyphenol hydroxylase-like FAD-dependent oxidoreductase
LKPHNIHATILELRHKHAPSGGYLALAPNACRALKHIGAYDRIRKQGYNFEELQMLSARNMSLIGTIYNGHRDRYGYKACRVGRGIVRDTLIDMAHEQHVEIKYEAKVVDVKEDETTSKVILTMSDGTTEVADYVIGADGIHSRLRKYIDHAPVPRFSGQMGIGGPVDAIKLEKVSNGIYMPCMIFGKDNSFAFMPCTPDGDKIGVFATLEANDRPREQWNALMKDKQHLANSLEDQHNDSSEWPEIVKTACREVDVENLSLWPYYTVPVLKDWKSKSGRVILIGDAAHGIPPTGGQGAAMAFEDAGTLANVLATSHQQDHQAVSSLLDRWQDHRKARIAKVLAFTSKSGDSRKASPGLLQQIFKEWAMWAYFLIRGKGMGLGWMYEYDTETVKL